MDCERLGREGEKEKRGGGKKDYIQGRFFKVVMKRNLPVSISLACNPSSKPVHLMACYASSNQQHIS